MVYPSHMQQLTCAPFPTVPEASWSSTAVLLLVLPLPLIARPGFA